MKKIRKEIKMRLKDRDIFLLGLHLLNIMFFAELYLQPRKAFFRVRWKQRMNLGNSGGTNKELVNKGRAVY